MASSPSGQNFLRLLFGGANQGLDRTFQQQDQSTDLAMQLQQMMTRQKEFRERTDLIRSGQEGTQARFEESLEADQEKFDYRREQDSLNRARQGNIDIFNQMQAWRDRVNEATTRKAQNELRKAQAAYYRSGTAGGSGSKAQKRLALTGLKKDILNEPTNYETISAKAWKKLPPPVQAMYEKGADGKEYRMLHPGRRQEVSRIDKELRVIGELEDASMFGTTSSDVLDIPGGVVGGRNIPVPAPPNAAAQRARMFLEDTLEG